MARDLTGKHPSYFESTLQLREVSEEVILFAEKLIAELKLQISKKVELKNGIDYLLTDNELTRKAGKRLQDHFGGELLVTATLHTKKDGKDLFRVTILFRPLHFKKGDIVEYQDEKYEVKSVTKDIFLQNIKTGKKLHLKYKEMRQITTE